MDRKPIISFFALTNGRPPQKTFRIKQADRLSHVYVISKTGTGKSTLLYTLAQQDLFAQRGFCLVDPHGDLAEQVAAEARREGQTDIIYWDVPNPSSLYGYNPLRHVRSDKIPLAVAGILDAFKKLWDEACRNVRHLGTIAGERLLQELRRRIIRSSPR